MDQTLLTDALSHFPGGLLITDRESRVLYASAALERRTGFSVAEIVGKKPGQLWGGKMDRSFYQNLWQTIGTEGKSFVGRVRNSKKNGVIKDEHIFIVPIRDQAGKTEFFAEVHPELPDLESEEAFAREFLERTDDGVQDKHFFTWLFQSLRKKSDGTLFGADRSFWYDGFGDGARFFRDVFIAPMEKSFVRRQEDALLIARAQADPELYSELYEKYSLLVREYFLRRLQGNLPLAEDLSQEVFVRAFRYFPSFRMANASYYTYLLHVAHSVLVNHYRQDRCDTISLSGNEEKEMTASPEEERGPGEMDNLLKNLSETERNIMLFKYREGLKIREVARRVGKTENAVKLILSRTRKKLKKALV